MMVQACNFGTWEVETGSSEIQGHPQLDREFKASPDYKSSYL